MTGLEDARAYLNGARDGFTVHEVEVPEPNVVAMPRQDGIAHNRPLPKASVCRWERSSIWEQGRRRPEGPARVLLAQETKNGRPSFRTELVRRFMRTAPLTPAGRLQMSRGFASFRTGGEGQKNSAGVWRHLRAPAGGGCAPVPISVFCRFLSESRNPGIVRAVVGAASHAARRGRREARRRKAA